MQAIKAVGRSDAVLKVDVPIRIFAIMILLISLKHSVYVFAISEIAVTLFGTILYIIVSEKIIYYTCREVCYDFFINVVLATIMGLVVFVIGKVISLHPIIIMFIQILIGAFIYIILSILTKSRSYLEIKETVFKIIFKYKRG